MVLQEAIETISSEIETIPLSASDCVLMRPLESSKPSYVARIEKIESDNRGANVRVYVRWYYRPKESLGGRRQFHGSKEVFLFDHYDYQSADTIEAKCTVHTFKSYTKLDAVGNDDFFCRFEYNSSTESFNPDRVAVYCKCEMPYNPDDLMVQCEGCSDCEVTSMDHDHTGQLIFCGDGQEAFKKKKARTCEGCGLNTPLKNYTEKVDLAPGGLQLCNTCARLTKLKQYCGICNKIWNRSDKGSWVRCDGCKVWVHAECDKIPTSHLKDLGTTDYYCPQCRAKFNFELSDSENCQPKVKKSDKLALPDKVTVICTGVEGIYFPSLHLCSTK